MSKAFQFPEVSLDSIDDLQGFELPPLGRYQCLLTLEGKDIGGKSALEFQYKINATIELADAEATEPEAGKATFNELFFLDKLQFCKAKLAILAEALGLPENIGLAELVECVKQVGVEVTLKARNGKPDDEGNVKQYASVPAETFVLS